MGAKTGYARYTFAFASDVQRLADEKHIKVVSFKSTERKNHRGSYDVLTVSFLVPRPDRDEIEAEDHTPGTLETNIHELEEELEDDNEVITNEI